MSRDSEKSLHLRSGIQQDSKKDLMTSDSDASMLAVLELYLDRRTFGPVDHPSFIAEQATRYPQLSLEDQLPGLIASIDALNGFATIESPSTESSEWENLVSRTLGDFEILCEVGRGGMGIVYKARQLSLDRVVALKVLPLSIVLDKQQVSRFMIEAQAAGQLNHPNIVPIYGVGQEDGVHCYSMPLIEGQSLDQVIATCQRDVSNVSTALRWIIQAADAIEHAHSHGVIHRDIKPSNLIIDQQNKLWVTDFGLARCSHADNQTQTGVVVGTRRYMSPEQARGNPALVDHRSDIYGLGMTLWELLTGDQSEQADRTSGSPPASSVAGPRRIRSCNRFVSRDIETVVMKALAADANERYQSASDLSADLRRALGGNPIHARRPSVLDRMTKWTVRHRRPVAAIGVVAAVTLIGMSLATAIFARQRTELRTALTRADHNLLLANEGMDQAEENLRQTRDVLDRFGLMAAEELRGIAGAENVREKLVRDLLRFYEDNARQTQANPTLQLELADTHVRAAKIIDELGAHERALKVYQRAVDLFERQPRSDAVQYQLVLCRNRIAVLHAELGRPGLAEQVYRQTLEQLRPLADHSPERTRTLATVHGNLGLLLASESRVHDAKHEFHLAVQLLPPDTSNSVADALTAAMIFNNLGHLARDTDVDEAFQFNGRAIATLRSVIEIDANGQPAPSNSADAIDALALSLNNQASLLVRMQRDASAMPVYQDAIELLRNLVDRLPTAVRYTEELAITYNNYGRCLNRVGRLEDAQQTLERSRGLIESLIHRRPDETRYDAALAGVQGNLNKISRPFRLQSSFTEAQP